MISIDAFLKKISFLYDIVSQFTIMSRRDYNKLDNKPLLQPIDKQGTSINGILALMELHI